MPTSATTCESPQLGQQVPGIGTGGSHTLAVGPHRVPIPSTPPAPTSAAVIAAPGPAIAGRALAPEAGPVLAASAAAAPIQIFVVDRIAGCVVAVVGTAPRYGVDFEEAGGRPSR